MIQALRSLALLSAALLLVPTAWAAEGSLSGSQNSVGIKMLSISPGTFEMGAETNSFNLGEKTAESKDGPYWDETPQHKVTLTKAFRISEEKVTTEQFRRFRADFQPTGYFGPYATGVSWSEAMEFCKWLSEKEAKTYRLPTEAEWEYACRAGTTSLFWSGSTPPRGEDVNPWGLKRMHSGPAEWCYDWHGEYPAADQVDPVGYDSGWARVVRGGAVRSAQLKNADGSTTLGPDLSPVWYRCANRCSLMPDTPSFDKDHICQFVGFRVVEAELPATKPLYYRPDFPLEAVKQSPASWTNGPDSSKPYFKARVIVSSPPDFTSETQCAAVGLNRAVQGKLHSGGITFCPNGDLLAISFSSMPGKAESAPNTCMVATRLRRGAEEWDLPGLFYKLSGLNDQSVLMWNDNGTLWFFGGGRDLGQVPFRFTTSKDSGATWRELKPAVVTEPMGQFVGQPITSAFRGPDGTIYVGCDARGAKSLLWASKDEGKTWFDTGGRTAGRHTTFVLLKDNRILGMGGKDSNIEGFMPKCYSPDFGKSWSPAEKTPFAALGSNQRPKILRLASGRLFFAGDYQNIRILSSPPPSTIKERGSYVALSDDEGQTWKTKRLALATPHVGWTGVAAKNRKPQHGFGTLGYCDAVQTPDGLIHIITSKGKPSMHFAMNEAWILSTNPGETNQSTTASARGIVFHEEENWPNGKTKATWSWFTADNGVVVLQGKETWNYPDGTKEYEVTRENGKKLGVEEYFRPDGSKDWARDYRKDGSMTWVTYWPNGAKKSESHWQGMMARGTTTVWNTSGKVAQKSTFKDGRDTAFNMSALGDD